MYTLTHIQRAFDRMGAQLRVAPLIPQRWGPTSTFTLDVETHKQAERFVLAVQPHEADTLTFAAPHVDRARKHLLLVVRHANPRQPKEKFLCGHDERHWFVAGVPRGGGVTTVADAMEALKPLDAWRSQRLHGVKAKDWHARHNAGFVRQGEWFFIPTPDFMPEYPQAILRNEPLRRDWRSKPHMIEELYRFAGTTVYVNRQYPRGLREPQYRKLLQRKPEARGWPWRIMRRNPQVLVRGRVRHTDHATIKLNGWHRVLMNAEFSTGSVAFLD